MSLAPIAVTTTPFNISPDNDVYLVDATSGPIILNLPDYTLNNGYNFYIKK